MLLMSISKFAKYMARKPSSRDGVLRDIKKGQAKRQASKENGERTTSGGNIHYEPACKIIREVHRNNLPIAWISTAAKNLKNEISEGMSPQTIRSLIDCHRGLIEYQKCPIEGPVDPLKVNIMTYSRPNIGISINIKPDLHIVRQDWEEIYKFNFSEEKILGVQRERYWDAYTKIMYLAMRDNEAPTCQFRSTSYHTHYKLIHFINKPEDIDELEIKRLLWDIVRRWQHISV